MWQITVRDGFLQAAYIGAITVDLVYFTSWKNDKHSPKTLETNYLDRFFHFKNIGFFLKALMRIFEIVSWLKIMKIDSHLLSARWIIWKKSTCISSLKYILHTFIFHSFKSCFPNKKALFKTFALRHNHNALQLLQFIASYLPHPGAETGACPVWLLAGPCCFRLV